MRKIAVITATRAEYGLLSPVILALRECESSSFRVDLIVTGTHLVNSYGHTIDEIINDNVRIDYEISIPISNNSELDISNNQAETLVLFTKHFERESYDGVLILGDRYEMLAIAIAAANTKTPLFHMCGGDTTEGAMDEWIRHSITKMSYLHFVTNEDSRRRVIQLGENPKRVFNYGSTSIDNILMISDLGKTEALSSIDLIADKYALCTFQPVTLDNDDVVLQVKGLLSAIKSHPEIEFIVTKANSDQYGYLINQMFDDAAMNIANMHVYSSLGIKRYLSLMRYTAFVIGNSSSGIIEAPSFGIPTINIGERQKGRLRADSILDCGYSAAEINDAIDKAMDIDFRHKCQETKSPYGDGQSGIHIAKKIVEVVENEDIQLMKSFYDIK